MDSRKLDSSGESDVYDNNDKSETTDTTPEFVWSENDQMPTFHAAIQILQGDTLFLWGV